MPDKKVTVAAILTLSASRPTVSKMVMLVSLPGIMKSESGAKRSVTLPIITLITAYVPVDREVLESVGNICYVCGDQMSRWI